MIKYFLALTLLLFALKAYSQPFIRFDTTNVNVGDICDGPEFEVYWTFTNISDTTVVIDHANSTGPMLASEWPTEPIKPGGTGKIHGTLLTTGWMGRSFYRTILVQLTNGSRNTISVKGDVHYCEPGINFPKKDELVYPSRVGE
ncbi:MAG: DUF1573 domain-containing protein [Sphingobacteriales bacterium]|nr:MAG: DUF1573 domain-containing protein [Sphingobacteriales bacterium]